MTPEVTALERALCAHKNIYACRTLSYKFKRSSTPADCANGNNPNTCLEWSFSSPAAVRIVFEMYRDGCRHGVLRDCVVVAYSPATIPREERREAMVLSCLYTGACSGIARMMRMQRDLEEARYYLQIACRLHDQCIGLAAMYREGHVRELWQGHAAEVLIRACRLEDDCETRLNDEIADLRKPPDRL